MSKQRFTEKQIIDLLKEQDAGAMTTALCRKHGISRATFYNWKAKYGGTPVSETKRLNTLEDENAVLKRLLAENAMLKRLLAEQMLEAATLREFFQRTK